MLVYIAIPLLNDVKSVLYKIGSNIRAKLVQIQQIR
jgi:hypothetical protein